MKEVALAALIVAALLTGCEVTRGGKNDGLGKPGSPMVTGGYSTSPDAPESGVGSSAFTFTPNPSRRASSIFVDPVRPTPGLRRSTSLSR